MKTHSIRIGLVEDQGLIRDLLTEVLSRVENLEVAFAVGSVAEARVLFKDIDVDVALLDIELPDGNGIGLAASIRASRPQLGIVLLSARDMLELVMGLPDETRRGWSYISKDSTTDIDVLVNTIRATAKGMSVVDPALVDRSQTKPNSLISQLTPKQLEVLRLVAKGLNNQAISSKMKLSLNSVVNHLTAIYAVLGIAPDENTRVAATLRLLAETEH